MPLWIRLGAAVVALASAGALGGSGAAQATAGQARPLATSFTTTGFTTTGEVLGLAALSPANAWAIGYSGRQYFNAKTLILHWNGRKWARITTPAPVYGQLHAVDAISPDNVWAVGDTATANGSDPRDLIMHWNGRAWSRPSGFPALTGFLWAVAGTTAGAWAVGGADLTATVLHWTGGRWFVVPTDAPSSSVLDAVVATGPRTAWVGGDYSTGVGVMYRTVFLRWTGSAWKRVSATPPLPYSRLVTLTPGRAGTVWALAYSEGTSELLSTISVWNGRIWRNLALPSPEFDNMSDVTIVAATAWVVGADSSGALILRRTGSAWTQLAGRPGCGQWC